jgi:hypothetical protein
MANEDLINATIIDEDSSYIRATSLFNNGYAAWGIKVTGSATGLRLRLANLAFAMASSAKFGPAYISADILEDSDIDIRNCSFTDINAHGALTLIFSRIVSSTIAIDSCTFRNCHSAIGDGGGLYMTSLDLDASVVKITGSIFNNCSTLRIAGALVVAFNNWNSSRVEISSNVVTNSRSMGTGVGVFVQALKSCRQSSLTLVSNTFADTVNVDLSLVHVLLFNFTSSLISFEDNVFTNVTAKPTSNTQTLVYLNMLGYCSNSTISAVNTTFDLIAAQLTGVKFDSLWLTSMDAHQNNNTIVFSSLSISRVTVYTVALRFVDFTKSNDVSGIVSIHQPISMQPSDVSLYASNTNYLNFTVTCSEGTEQGEMGFCEGEIS